MLCTACLTGEVVQGCAQICFRNFRFFRFAKKRIRRNLIPILEKRVDKRLTVRSVAAGVLVGLYRLPESKTLSAAASRACILPSALSASTRLQRSTSSLRFVYKASQATMAAHENSATPGTAKAGLDVARSGWFTELSTMWKGQGLSFQVEKTLFQDRSKFQVRIVRGLCIPTSYVA